MQGNESMVGSLIAQAPSHKYVQVEEAELREILAYLEKHGAEKHSIKQWAVVGHGQGSKDTASSPVDKGMLRDSILSSWEAQLAQTSEDPKKDVQVPKPQETNAKKVRFAGNMKKSTIDTSIFADWDVIDDSVRDETPKASTQDSRIPNDTDIILRNGKKDKIDFAAWDQEALKDWMVISPVKDKLGNTKHIQQMVDLNRLSYNQMFKSMTRSWNFMPLESSYRGSCCTDICQKGFFSDWPSFDVAGKIYVLVTDYTLKAFTAGFVLGFNAALNSLYRILERPLVAAGAGFAAAFAVTVSPQLVFTALAYVMIGGIVGGGAMALPVLVIGTSGIFISASVYHSFVLLKRTTKKAILGHI